MKRILCGLLVLTAIAPVAPVLAQGLGVGPRAGYYRHRDAGSGDFLLGAALRTKFLTVLGAEASIDYRQDSYAGDVVTARSWPIQVTGLIYPFTVLYGSVGAGWYRTTYEFDIDGLDNETQSEFGWHLGTGLEIPLGPAASLTGDMRWVYLDTELSDLPESARRNTDFYVMSFGVIFGL